MTERVVVTGMGVVSPLGGNLEDSWERVAEGCSGASRIEQFDASTWPTQIACEVKDFQLPVDAILPQQASLLSRPTSFGVAAAWQAMRDAKIDQPLYDPDFGIAVGASLGPMTPLGVATSLQDGHAAGVPGSSVLTNHPGTLAGLLGTRWKAGGAVTTVHTACASSSQAIGLAFRQIQRGELRAVLAGGADSLASELMLSGFCLLGALSKRNDRPQEASRPFDQERDGFVAGEGSAMLLMESLSSARKRGVPIIGEVLGYGETGSAYRITDLPPDGRGVIEAMELALADSQLSPADIDYVNAHGTSTELNDRVEAMCLERVFSSSGGPAVSSTKSETGHLISAAGAMEIVFCLQAAREQRVPPTRNLKNPDCGERLDHVTTARRTRVRRAMSNSIGFGGSNSVLIVGEFDSMEKERSH